jgi:hypothetical protein
MTITRAHCGFAAFQCDPSTCRARCFTARVIEINDRQRAAKLRSDRWNLAIIPATILAMVIVGAVAFTLPDTIERVNVAHLEDMQ